MIDNNFVPAIIVPQGHPNPYIFNLLKNLIPTEYTGTLLSFK